jgi:hypothetical protein
MADLIRKRDFPLKVKNSRQYPHDHILPYSSHSYLSLSHPSAGLKSTVHDIALVLSRNPQHPATKRLFSPITTLLLATTVVKTQEMGQVTSKLSRNDTNLPRVPRNIKFRVLIIGRANAGKTTILQKVCDTTESPEIYRLDQEGHRERVRSPL